MSRRKKKKATAQESRPTSQTEDRVETNEEAPPATETVEPSEIGPASIEEESRLEQLQRLQAEFSNYRKRTQRERVEWDKRARGGVLSALLPILDDLSRARGSIGDDPGADDVKGLLLIFSRFEESLRSLGLKMQPSEPGTPFDPNHHEAILTEPSDEHPEGMILGTIQPGYLYDDLLLRPVRVRVSRGPEVGADREDSSTTAEAGRESGSS